MKVSLIQQIKLAGLTLAIAALSYQPTFAANAQQVKTVDALKGSQPALAIGNKAAVGKSASFVGNAGHNTTGGVKIIEEAGQRYLEFDGNFQTDGGPDLFVLLHRESVPTAYTERNYVSLGRLQRVARTQKYLIPADVDISAFSSAVVWCRQFDVTFGYATL